MAAIRATLQSGRDKPTIITLRFLEEERDVAGVFSSLPPASEQEVDFVVIQIAGSGLSVNSKAKSRKELLALLRTYKMATQVIGVEPSVICDFDDDIPLSRVRDFLELIGPMRLTLHLNK